MGIRTLIKEEKAGFPEPVYFIHSKDRYLLRDAELRVRKTISTSPDSLSIEIFDADLPGSQQIDPASIANSLMTPGFFGEKKAVLIRNAHKINAKTMKKILPKLIPPPPDVLIVILSEKAPPQDIKKESRIKVLHLELKGNALIEWTIKRAEQKGIRINREVAEILAGMTSENIGQIERELEKLTLLGKEEITPHDLSGVISGGIETSIFALTTRLTSKDQEGVFRLFHSMRDTLEPIPALGAINWKYGQLASKGGKPEYYRKVFKEIHEADLLLKSSGGEYPLEDLLVRLLQI
ncbi:MAG: hypothetical protein D6726_01095 [Nitrospirae bacterium]|nr:MAG: hypothetical protein D6726_01095 [Nitrospirota bacterium]